MKKVFSLLLAMLIIVSLAVPAFAAQTAVFTIKGKNDFEVGPGSGYTDSDLFPEFKNMMPGDTLTQEIRVENKCKSYDYVKVSFKAVPHGVGNELSYSETFENKDGKDQANVDGKRDETIASMEEFLGKLTMTIYNKNGKVVYEGPAVNAPKDDISLGTIRKNKSVDFDVALYWYPDANEDNDKTNDYDYNKFANRVGEVDWKITVEYRDDPDDSPKTGDYIIMGAVALMAVSAAALVILFVMKKKRKK